jgi:hypothetical protein
MKQELLAYMAKLLSEVKDPKTFFLRTLTMLVLIFGWTLVEHPDTFLRVAKEFTRDSVIESLEKERMDRLPIVSRERVNLIYGQVYADLVYVATYNPKQQNDYLRIVAREGEAGGSSFDMRTKLVIMKASKMYLEHLSSRTFTLGNGTSHAYSDLLFNGTRLEEAGIKFLFTCPIYSIDNIYSGHIGIGYNKDPEGLPAGFLESICNPNARAIGGYL